MFDFSQVKKVLAFELCVVLSYHVQFLGEESGSLRVGSPYGCRVAEENKNIEQNPPTSFDRLIYIYKYKLF